MDISNSLCLQWGKIVNTQYGTYDTYYPIVFPKAVYCVVATDWASPNNTPYACAVAVDVNGWNTTRFVAHFQNHWARGFTWFAVGR